jgi:hypothetical protein
VPEIQCRLITYCTNIHPADSWSETFAALKRQIPEIKHAISPSHPFPIGLRLSGRAAKELTPQSAAIFAAWLAEQECFVPTVNGFPFGTFHGTPVKEKVYLPDWRSVERVEYTKRLADLLAGWLPEHGAGSISTVPVGFKSHVAPSDLALAGKNLLDVLMHLERLRQETGRMIVLALEPEPACVLETTNDLVGFLDGMQLTESLRGQIGICLDCCHAALNFEEPAEVLALLAEAGVRVAKVQVSSALRQKHGLREPLARFQEPCYLHQVAVRRQNGTLVRYNDLPDALKLHESEGSEEWRCHYHLPLFLDDDEQYQTTRRFIADLLPLLDRRILLEVETYTWEALPPDLRTCDLGDAIVRELRWLQEKVDATDRRP